VAAREFAKSKNLPVVYYQQYPNAATDLTNVLTALKSTGTDGGVPDMVLASGHVAEDITIIKASKQLNINPKLFAFTVGPATPEFVTSLSKDANFVLSSSQWTAEVKYNGIDVFKTASNYAQLYRQEYGHEPSYQSAESTAAGLAFQYAIQQAGSIDPQKVRDALAKLDIMTFYGRVKFDETGANTFKPMVTVQIQEGKIITVYPADVANGKIQYPTPPFSQRQ
jgi:branched-chain amino acid transport system substrate-binding protein